MPGPDDQKLRGGSAWLRMQLQRSREHIPRRNGAVGAPDAQIPRMASPYGVGARWHRSVPDVLADSGSTRNEVKENSAAMLCADPLLERRFPGDRDLSLAILSLVQQRSALTTARKRFTLHALAANVLPRIELSRR